MTAPALTATLPTTVVLTLAAATVQPGDQVQTLPFHALRRSALNPRKTFNEADLTELARNIYERTGRNERGEITSTGIIQNLLARPEGDHAEIAAGERRYRAVELLVSGVNIEVRSGTDANGQPVMTTAFIQVPNTYPMPVLVQTMTDAELIEAATVENIQRADMTPLEEADAYMALIDSGKTEDYIALRYGKHPNTVRNRIQLAAGLGKEGRKLLESDQISLDTAKLIAGSRGELKKLLIDRAKAGSHADSLKNMVKNAGFMVENAIFDVAASGLNIELNLLGDMPSKFSNYGAAMNAQIHALEVKRAELEATGQWKEVVIQPVESIYADLPSAEWHSSYMVPHGFTDTCFVLAYNSTTGRVKEHPGVARKDAVKAYEQARRREKGRSSGAGSAQIGSGVREAAHIIGHQTRCEALDAYHATHPKATLALACAHLVQTTTHRYGGLMTLRTDERKEAPVTPESRALAAQIATRFPVFVQDAATGALSLPACRFGDYAALYDALLSSDVSEADLTLIFAYYTHRTVGGWANHTNRPDKALNTYAERVGAAGDVQRHFTLTPEFLNAHTAADLGTLVQQMPSSARPTYKHGASKKDMVSAIMEKASALKAAGWVPDIVQFK